MAFIRARSFAKHVKRIACDAHRADVRDVVAVRDERESARERLCVVLGVTASDALRVRPMRRDDDGVWFENVDEKESERARASCRVVASEYGQRMERDRRLNPHGEHAVECWIVSEEEFQGEGVMIQ